ncbi:MAG: hypothetical protein H0X24_20895 [Ktedonobacterales bacterium]|nr:hypothetical protein [Ktedonobacterales bacterium]
MAQPQPFTMKVPDPAGLLTATRPLASQLYGDISTDYLQFRRTYFREQNPTLATEPPLHPSPHHDETARLAETALKAIPGVVQSVPLLGDIYGHLHRVVNIHTLTENELLMLHNVTMVFLYGTRDGLQAWYVEYLNNTAHQLADVKHGEYYIEFPFHGLFYIPPEDLVKFDIAIKQGDPARIAAYVQNLAEHLATALRDPFHGQEHFSFAGPDGDRHRTIFNLKTTAGLAIGGYLALEAVRSLVSPHTASGPAQPAIHLVPPEMQQFLLTPPPAGQ